MRADCTIIIPARYGSTEIEEVELGLCLPSGTGMGGEDRARVMGAVSGCFEARARLPA